MTDNETQVEAGSNELEIIEFYIDVAGKGAKDEPERVRFGVNVAKVLEVIESPDLSPPPGAAHKSFLGTIPLRDKVLPVIDLARWLEVEALDTGLEVILVSRFQNRVVGFRATGVTQIHRLSWADVKPPGKMLEKIDSNCITALARINEHFIQMIDLERIMAELDPDFTRGEQLAPRTAASAHRVLVAEDSRLMRSMIAGRLREAGFDVEEAVSGQEALDRLQQRTGKNEAFSVVVTDIEMPAMDGYSLTRAIKEDPGLAAMPVILFSSLITDEMRHRGQNVGADDQISKPELDRLAHTALDLAENGRPQP